MPTRDEAVAASTGAYHTPGHLLTLIRNGTVRTRREIQDFTGLSRATVAQRIEQLLRGGYLDETATAASTGGRPAVLLRFNERHGYILAADLGATRGRFALLDLAGRVLAEQACDLTIGSGPQLVLDCCERIFAELLDQAAVSRDVVCGVGLGVPGPVEHEAGLVRQPPIMPGWDGFPIADHLTQRWQVPVLVDNDANLMALGEHNAHYPGSPATLLVKVSTGIGAGVVINGRVYRGIDGGAGDIGHVRLHGHDDARCMCGAFGCLAAVASGGAIAAAMTRAGVPTDGSRGLVAHLNAGQPDAVRLTRIAGQLLGEVLATVVCLLNPQAVVIAGDLADTHFVAGVREELYRRALPRATRHLTVTTSRLREQAGLHGAHAMVMDHVYSAAAVDTRLGAVAA
ncbi:ROK family transcriptional regulator [Catellatospora vulcania]|uniref:ROK family transcriptional regulator n=1 Tax=Catellatospora vulcania TaxID=1460450 RepID=UPI0012D43C82|nr:ROK family transcriptional regulator [Catellatospora vulcania]